MARKKDSAVFLPNLGLFFDRPKLVVPERGLIDSLNVRLIGGKINNLNLGWSVFGSFNPLNGPVTLVDNFVNTLGAQILIFGTTKDLYQYNEGTGAVAFLTRRFETGTVDVSAANPAVVTVNTGTPLWLTNASPGDAIFFGSIGQTDPDATTWYTVDTVDSDTQMTLTTAVTGAPLTAQAYTLRQLFAADIDDYWRHAVFFNDAASGDDLWFATNGVDRTVKWDGVADQITVLTAQTFVCKELSVFKNMLIYANIVEDAGAAKPNSIKNSDISKPEELALGLAGEFVIKDGEDPIIGLRVLGDNLVAYSERGGVISQFVGDPLVFIFRTSFSGLGPISGRLIADFGTHHLFIGPDTAYSFDGVSLRERDTHVWREVVRQRDPSRIALGFAVVDEEQGEVVWVVPLASDANGPTESTSRFGWNMHYLEETGEDKNIFYPYTKRDMPFTSTGFFDRAVTLTWDQISDTWQDLDFRWNDRFFEAAFPFVLMGTEDGKVFSLNTASSQAGTATVSRARFGRRVLRPEGRARDRALMTRLYPFATQFPAASGYTLDVTIHLSDHPSGPITASPVFEFDLTLPEEGHFVSVFRRARFAEIEFGTPGLAEPWEVDGYDWDVKEGGKR